MCEQSIVRNKSTDNLWNILMIYDPALLDVISAGKYKLKLTIYNSRTINEQNN